MGFPEEEEEDDEDMNMSHPLAMGQGTFFAQTASKKSSNDTPVLDNFGTDMTRAAEEGKTRSGCRAWAEIERLADIESS